MLGNSPAQLVQSATASTVSAAVSWHRAPLTGLGLAYERKNDQEPQPGAMVASRWACERNSDTCSTAGSQDQGFHFGMARRLPGPRIHNGRSDLAPEPANAREWQFIATSWPSFRNLQVVPAKTKRLKAFARNPASVLDCLHLRLIHFRCI